MGDHQDNPFRPPLTTMMPPLRPPLKSILHPPGMMGAPRRPPPDELRGLSRMQAPGPSASKGSLAPLSEDGTNTQQQTSIPPTIPRSNNPNLAAHQSAGLSSSSGGRGGSEGVKLSSWEQYWDRKDVCKLEDRGSFNVYTAGDKGAVLLCLHGGGYTGLTWSLVAKQLKDRYRVVAPDLRCHGMSSTWEDEDFSKGTMAADITALWSSLFGCDPQPAPVVVVGHSMGGALACGLPPAEGGLTGLAGVVVVDVVEGTAIGESSPRLRRPALIACDGQRQQQQGSSSRVDVPSSEQGMNSSGQEFGAHGRSGSAPQQQQQQQQPVSGILCASEVKTGGWVWRTPLLRSEPFWRSGTLPCPKLLILAGTDRLDKVLTIGQMQGKFQMVLLPQAGHAIHEDEPVKTADALLAFLKRFRVGEPAMALPKAFGVVRSLPTVAGPML
ncbi:MAG: hypothetical protein WDW38_004524 [Sanguina aurantia]